MVSCNCHGVTNEGILRSLYRPASIIFIIIILFSLTKLSLTNAMYILNVYCYIRQVCYFYPPVSCIIPQYSACIMSNPPSSCPYPVLSTSILLMAIRVFQCVSIFSCPIAFCPHPIFSPSFMHVSCFIRQYPARILSYHPVSCIYLV